MYTCSLAIRPCITFTCKRYGTHNAQTKEEKLVYCVDTSKP